MKKDSILVIGACGQIGSELVPALRRTHGAFRVVAADRHPPDNGPLKAGPYEQLDVLDRNALGALIERYDIQQVYHLAATLSATGERNPQQAWDLNMQGLLNVLDCAREKKLIRVFWPSSIAVFGPHPPNHGCPQDEPHDPTTVYGISKLAGELPAASATPASSATAPPPGAGRPITLSRSFSGQPQRSATPATSSPTPACL
jgi:nucleoside-diphosphate-sugar epimerase